MRKILIVILAIILLVFTGCTRTIENNSDEIKLNSWYSKIQNNKTVSLTFKGDCGSLLIRNKKDKNVLISGLCAIDDKNLIIFDKDTKENFVFTYKLSGNKLKLLNKYGKISLNKLQK